MTQFNDDLYLGNGQAIGYLGVTVPGAGGIGPNPTRQQGVGPMGRIAFRDFVPLTAGTANVAALQHTTATTALALTAGAGVTSGTAPDGSGSTVLVLDQPRCVSLTSANNMSGQNFTLTGYDEYGAKLTSTIAGPNANTVTFPKAVLQVLSIVPSATDGVNNVSVGTSDVFGLQWVVSDAGHVLPKWGNAMPLDTGTLVEADATSPATSATGDVRGTYMPSSASNGVNRLVIWMHLTAAQCGSSATLVGAVGVAQA